MKFVYFANRIHPADEEAAAYVAGMTEGDELELVPSKRTSLQNSSMWLYCTHLAGALNAAGFDLRTFPFRDGLSIPFTKASVMEHFWRPIQMAMVDKKSTTKLGTKEVSEIYTAVDQAIFDRTGGVRVDFPCRDSQMREALGRSERAA